MSAQPELFDAPLGEYLKTVALDQVETHADPDWFTTAVRTLRDLAGCQQTLTSDDVWHALSLNQRSTHEPRALGAVFRAVARDGFIHPTDEYVKSRRPECHSRPIRVWRST